MRQLTADTKIRVKTTHPPLTGDTRIRLRQIKDLAAWAQDHIYQNGEISPKTGLMKTPEGWIEPPKGIKPKKPDGKTTWRVPKSLGAVAKVYTAKADVSVRKGKSETYTLKAGSKVNNIELIARGHGIKTIGKLIKKYKRPNGSATDATDWTKKKGIGTVIDKNGNERQAELHWYECQGMGKMEFKVKAWKE